MKEIVLPNTGRSTSQLGFGCGNILPENAKLLEIAYDAGIRHFDVARSYGRGLTECVMASFVKRHRSDISITTKYGIVPPSIGPIYPFLRRVGRPIVRLIRRSSTADFGISKAIASTTRKAKFTAEEAAHSLEVSLRSLGVNAVDIFLMHEATVADLADEGLLRFLNDCKEKGRIGAYGIGGSSERINGLCTERRPYCEVLQFDWTPFEKVDARLDAFQIVYRSFSHSNTVLHEALSRAPEIRNYWSQQTGFDIAEPDALKKLMLKATLELRPRDIVLFSSLNRQHIAHNVDIANDNALREPALRLAKLLLNSANEDRSIQLYTCGSTIQRR